MPFDQIQDPRRPPDLELRRWGMAGRAIWASLFVSPTQLIFVIESIASWCSTCLAQDLSLPWTSATLAVRIVRGQEPVSTAVSGGKWIKLVTGFGANCQLSVPQRYAGAEIGAQSRQSKGRPTDMVPCGRHWCVADMGEMAL